MKELLVVLMLWISQNTVYENVNTFPQVVIESPVILQNMSGYSKNVDVRALYSDDANRIWLSSDVDLNTLEGKSTMVHELVHYLQDEYPSREFVCWQNREYEAYKIQNQYLKAHGKFLDVNWLWVSAISRCPPPFAPNPKPEKMP